MKFDRFLIGLMLGKRYDVYQTLYLFFVHFFKTKAIKYIGDIMSKETFKTFARTHPEIANKVLEGKVTWQQLYELYEIYGEDNKIWDNYIERKMTQELPFKDLFEMIKKVDMNALQEGIKNIQKTISLIQNIGLPSNYEPKPLYKRFEE